MCVCGTTTTSTVLTQDIVVDANFTISDIYICTSSLFSSLSSSLLLSFGDGEEERGGTGAHADKVHEGSDCFQLEPVLDNKNLELVYSIGHTTVEGWHGSHIRGEEVEQQANRFGSSEVDRFVDQILA